jgi:succinyl-CoA synthetase beta subunit
MARLSLSDLSRKLELALEHAETMIEFDAQKAGVNPLIMQDANGRYILLDAYVALAQIRILEEIRRMSNYE